MNARIYSLDLGWLDRALARMQLWRDRRRTQRSAARRVGLLDSGELVLVDARGRATVIDEITVRTIDDTLWARSLLSAHPAAEGLRRGDVADTVARGQRGAAH